MRHKVGDKVKVRDDLGEWLLVPLVSRPTEAGEWVYIVNANGTGGCYRTGDVLHVVKSGEGTHE